MDRWGERQNWRVAAMLLWWAPLLAAAWLTTLPDSDVASVVCDTPTTVAIAGSRTVSSNVDALLFSLAQSSGAAVGSPVVFPAPLTSDSTFQNATACGSGGRIIGGVSTASLTPGCAGSGCSSEGGRDAFVIKLEAVGSAARNWTLSFGGAGDESVAAVMERPGDASGSVFVAGSTTPPFASANVGTLTTSTGGGGKDAFLMRVGASGAVEWTHVYGTVESDETVAACASLSSGTFVTTVSRVDASDRQRVLLARWRPDSTTSPTVPVLKATIEPSSDGNDVPTGAACTSTADVYVCGHTTGVVQAAGAAGGRDAFVVRLDEGGVVTFAAQLGGEGDDFATAVALSADRLFVTGRTTSSVFAGHIPDSPVFVARFDPLSSTGSSSTPVWIRFLPQEASALPLSMVRGAPLASTGAPTLLVVGRTEASSFVQQFTLTCSDFTHVDVTTEDCVSCPPARFNNGTHALTTCELVGCRSQVDPTRGLLVGMHEDVACSGPNDPSDVLPDSFVCQSDGAWLAVSVHCLPNNNLQRAWVFAMLTCTCLTLVVCTVWFLAVEWGQRGSFFFILMVFVSWGDFVTDAAYFLLEDMANVAVRHMLFAFLLITFLPGLLWVKSLSLQVSTHGLHSLSPFGDHKTLERIIMAVVITPLRLMVGFVCFLGLLASRYIAWSPAHAALARLQGFFVHHIDATFDEDDMLSEMQPGLGEKPDVNGDNDVMDEASGLRRRRADGHEPIELSPLGRSPSSRSSAPPSSARGQVALLAMPAEAVFEYVSEAAPAVSCRLDRDEWLEGGLSGAALLPMTKETLFDWLRERHVDHDDDDRHIVLNQLFYHLCALAQANVHDLADAQHMQMVVARSKLVTRFHVQRSVFNGVLLWELVLESIPQIVLQIYNAIQLRRTGPLFLASMGFSVYMIVRVFYGMVYQTSIRKKPFAAVHMF